MASSFTLSSRSVSCLARGADLGSWAIATPAEAASTHAAASRRRQTPLGLVRIGAHLSWEYVSGRHRAGCFYHPSVPPVNDELDGTSPGGDGASLDGPRPVNR